MSDEAELQRLLTAKALRVLDGRGFALAGSGAIREHGLVDRLTHDVDLFTNGATSEEFAAAVNLVVTELSREGFRTQVVRQSDAFAQLLISNADGQSVEMDLAVDWRERDVDAIRTDGRFTDQQLLREASERDAGFDQVMFASQLDRVSSLAYRRFEEYGVNEQQFAALQER